MNSKLFIAIFTLAILMSCSSKSSDSTKFSKLNMQTLKAGGGCQYKDFPGTIEITKIEPDPEADRNFYEDPVVVHFTFTPDDAEAEKNYRFTNFLKDSGKIQINAGKNPPRRCIEEQGYVEGSKHKAIRSELRKGTCTPVVFLFPDFDEKKCYRLTKNSKAH